MTDIAELFGRDPLTLTKPDLEEIVAYYREKRATFLSAGKVKAEKAAKKAAPPTLSLDDLDI